MLFLLKQEITEQLSDFYHLGGGYPISWCAPVFLPYGSDPRGRSIVYMYPSGSGPTRWPRCDEGICGIAGETCLECILETCRTLSSSSLSICICSVFSLSLATASATSFRNFSRMNQYPPFNGRVPPMISPSWLRRVGGATVTALPSLSESSSIGGGSYRSGSSSSNLASALVRYCFRNHLFTESAWRTVFYNESLSGREILSNLLHWD